MKVTYTADGKLQFDADDLFRDMPLESKLALADTLSCHDDVIKNVIDQVITGWTEMCSHGAKSFDAAPNPCFGLDYAVRQVALHSGELAKVEIERLQKALGEAQQELRDIAEAEFRSRRGY